jgi:hypothetical protein
MVRRFFFKRLLGLLALSLALIWPWPSLAQQVFRTQEADILYLDPSDLRVMESRIRFNQVDNFYQRYVYTPDPAQAVFSVGLAAKVDGLLTKVRAILNIWTPTPNRLRIFLLKNGSEVQQRLLVINPAAKRPWFGYGHLEGFYAPMTRTIFLSLDNLTAGILGHEMTHFILCESFPVPPPESIQEQWARYVETQIN